MSISVRAHKRAGHYVRKHTRSVQTLIFNKKKYTRKQASDWAKKHGFESYTSREEGNSIRVRQFNPKKVKRFLGTFQIAPEIKGVYAEVK